MLARHGQSIVEYTMIIAILTVVLYAMGTCIKRGVQSLVKVGADQIGNQLNADQDFNDVHSGYMQCSQTQTQDSRDDYVAETGFVSNTGVPFFSKQWNYNDATLTQINTVTNGGFLPDQ